MSQIKIHQGEKELTVNVQSVNCRYVDFSIRNDMSVEMKVPVGMSQDMIKKYVHLSKDDIFKAYEQRMTRNHQALPDTLELEDGRIHYRSGLVLPFLGQMNLVLRIKYQPEGEDVNIYIKRGRTRTGRSENQLVIRTDNDDQDFIRYCIIRYYRKCAEKLAAMKLDHFSKKMGLSYNSFRITGKPDKPRLWYAAFSSQNIDVKNQPTIWGSCNRKRNLKFDWKLAMLPLEVIEYIVVHELTHLKKMNHSKLFWNEVEQVMPEYAECRNWLNHHGKEYEIF